MEIRDRFYGPILKAKIEKPFVHLIFGARQTGKSTLVNSILPSETQIIDLSNPRERMRFAADPGLFIDICRSLRSEVGPSWVFVDEAQTVPSIFDAVQSLYDRDKERFRFILCGSSARRLRAQSANLLPGRSVHHLLHPLLTSEYAMETVVNASPRSSWPSFPWLGQGVSGAVSHTSKFPFRTLENRLIF
ncbi:MAG: AAA family ATPase, partial [Treponema sp.]|nr:AAA family ATPase [Treponema sp.]